MMVVEIETDLACGYALADLERETLAFLDGDGMRKACLLRDFDLRDEVWRSSAARHQEVIKSFGQWSGENDTGEHNE